MSLILLLALLLAGAIAVGGFDTGGPTKPSLGRVLRGLFIVAWGVMFLASYFYEHKTFFFRALIWVCEHTSHPATREVALLYGALGIILGVAAVLAGLDVL